MKNRIETEQNRPLGYWFGFLSSDNSKEDKFVFPQNTDSILIKWFNNIYDEFTEEETLNIWKNVSKNQEIKEISSQIWNELETLVSCCEGWSIG